MVTGGLLGHHHPVAVTGLHQAFASDEEGLG